MWEPANDRVTWENEWPYRIVGIPPSEAPVTAARFTAEFVHSDDLPAFETAIADTIEHGAPFFYQGRIRRPDGEQRRIDLPHAATRARWHTALLGTIQDITARKHARGGGPAKRRPPQGRVPGDVGP